LLRPPARSAEEPVPPAENRDGSTIAA